ncbi:MAG: DNA/RNA nuclease SfsA [Rhodospirillaceae bacterium]|nr:MAG: DNA/RNA nuclease SfsA [Rhodospirillaceae bacterium]
MDFSAPLIRGTLLERYKRFLSTIALEDGTHVTAHCPNPGSMMGLLPVGGEVWLSPAQNPKRKLHYTWELVRIGKTLVGINAAYANRIVEEKLVAGEIPQLAGYDTVRREVRYGQNSRIDFLLEKTGQPSCYVEVKSVTLRLGNSAAFPDSVTVRGAKHLAELAKVVQAGKRGVMLYLVQRGDCADFVLAGEIDPAYAAAMKTARAAGVEMLCFSCKMSVDAIELDRPLPFSL